MRGNLDVRAIEDIGDNALSYNEVKALAAGNPLLLDHAQAQAELTRLERLERNHHRGLDTLRATIRHAEHSIAAMRQRIADVDAAIARRVDVRGEAFAMTVDATRHTTRPGALQALRTSLQALMNDTKLERGDTRLVGRLGGFDVQATLYRDLRRHPTVQVQLVDVPLSAMTFSPKEVEQQDLVTRLTNRLHDLEKVDTDAHAEIDARTDDIAKATAQLDAPFRYAADLAQAQAHFAELDALLSDQAAPPPPPSPSAGGRASDAGPTREIQVDTGLDLSPVFAMWASWPAAPTQADQDWLERAAASVACAPDVQAAAVAGDARRFIEAYDGRLRQAVGQALAAGVLARDGFWATCLTDPQLRTQLAAGLRSTAYTTLRACAPRVGITPKPTTGDDRNQLASDASTRPGLPVNGRATATAIQRWLNDHNTDLAAPPGEDEQTRLTTLATAVARTPLVQDQALANDPATFAPLYGERLRNQVAAVINRRPDLTTTAPLLRAIAAGDHPGLVEAAADAAYQAIHRLAERLGKTSVPPDGPSPPSASAAKAAFAAGLADRTSIQPQAGAPAVPAPAPSRIGSRR